MKILLERERIHEGCLILVNEEFSLRGGEQEALTPAMIEYPDILLRREAAERLREALKRTGCADGIVPVSGYRSAAEQAKIYEESLRDNGAEFTRKYVALPYHSEHQTGLAIDLGLKQAEIDFIRPEFPYDGVCGAFRKAAPDYGFVERYPKGKEHLTGIAHEPWHFRYVGFPHSRIMTEERLTLEEYMEFVRDYPAGGKTLLWEGSGKQFEILYAAEETTGEAEAAKAMGLTELELPDGVSYQVSGNNVDGFIVTVWRD